MLGISIAGFLTFLQTAVFVVGYISNNSLFPEPLSVKCLSDTLPVKIEL